MNEREQMGMGSDPGRDPRDERLRSLDVQLIQRSPEIDRSRNQFPLRPDRRSSQSNQGILVGRHAEHLHVRVVHVREVGGDGRA